jgi:hypothetical protein
VIFHSPDTSIVAGDYQPVQRIPCNTWQVINAMQLFTVIPTYRKPKGNNLFRIAKIKRYQAKGAVVLARKEQLCCI